MTDKLAAARRDLAIANRIIAHEGILDVFGHVSMRHPEDPNRYLLSRTRAPELIEPSDIHEFTLDSEPVTPLEHRVYGEKVIHGCIYAARPDVMAVCHHHAPAIMPFCITGAELLPVFLLGSVIGDKVPYWDSRDEFGATNQMVNTPEEGRSHAEALGDNWMVLLRRHGATVVGTTLREMVFCTIYSTRNAEFQVQAAGFGNQVDRLTPEEMELARKVHLQPYAHARAWEYWLGRLEREGRIPA